MTNMDVKEVHTSLVQKGKEIVREIRFKVGRTFSIILSQKAIKLMV